jgi:hypothetical protein
MTALTDWPMMSTFASPPETPREPCSPTAAETRNAIAAAIHSAAPSSAPGSSRASSGGRWG